MSIAFNPPLRNLLGVGVALGVTAWTKGSHLHQLPLSRIFSQMSWGQAVPTITLCVSGQIMADFVMETVREHLQDVLPKQLYASPLWIRIMESERISFIFYSVLTPLAYSACYGMAHAMKYLPPQLTPTLLSSLRQQMTLIYWTMKRDVTSVEPREGFLVSTLIQLAANELLFSLCDTNTHERIHYTRVLLLISLLAFRCIVGALGTVEYAMLEGQTEQVMTALNISIHASAALLLFFDQDASWVKNGYLISTLLLTLPQCNREVQRVWDQLKKWIPEASPSYASADTPSCERKETTRSSEGFSRIDFIPLQLIASYLETRELEDFTLTSRRVYETVVPSIFPMLFPSLPTKMSMAKRFSLCKACLGPDTYNTFGVNVVAFPSLPWNILEILSSPCPFFPLQPVKDTHKLVLIPKTLNENEVTPDQIQELAQSIRQISPQHAARSRVSIPLHAVVASHWVLFPKQQPQLDKHSEDAQDSFLRGVRRSSYEIIPSENPFTQVFLERARVQAWLFADYLAGAPACYEKANLIEFTTCLLLNKQTKRPTPSARDSRLGSQSRFYDAHRAVNSFTAPGVGLSYNILHFYGISVAATRRL